MKCCKGLCVRSLAVLRGTDHGGRVKINLCFGHIAVSGAVPGDIMETLSLSWFGEALGVLGKSMVFSRRIRKAHSLLTKHWRAPAPTGPVTSRGPVPGPPRRYP